MRSDDGSLPPDALPLRLVRATGVTFVGDTFAKLAYLATQLVVARLLTVEDFGLFSLALVIASVSYILADLGIAKAALRYLPAFRVRAEPDRIKGLVYLILLVPLGAGILVGTALVLGAARIADLVAAPALEGVLLPAATAVPLMAATIATLEATRAFGYARFFVLAKQVTHPVANLAFVLVLARPQLTAERAIWAWVAATGLTLAVSVVYLKRILPPLQSVQPRLPGGEAVRYAGTALGVNLMSYLQVRVDILVLGFLVPVSAVGVYSAASHVVLAFAVAALAAQALFNPMVAELSESGRTEDLKRLYMAGSRWIGYLGLPVLLVVCLAPGPILQLFGPDYVVAADVLVVLAIGAFLGSAIGLSGPVLLMTGHQLRELGNAVLAVGFNCFLVIVLVPLIGILGAALATALTLVGFNTLRSWQVHSLIGVVPLSRGFLRSLLVTAIALIAAMMIGGPVSPRGARVALQLALALAILVLGLWRFGFQGEDRALLRVLATRGHGT